MGRRIQLQAASAHGGGGQTMIVRCPPNWAAGRTGPLYYRLGTEARGVLGASRRARHVPPCRVYANSYFYISRCMAYIGSIYWQNCSSTSMILSYQWLTDPRYCYTYHDNWDIININILQYLWINVQFLETMLIKLSILLNIHYSSCTCIVLEWIFVVCCVSGPTYCIH